jgi:Glycosyltransferase like family 2
MASKNLQPIPIPAHASYTASQDVTVIVPTMQSDSSFTETFLTWIANDPLEIIIVTIDSKLQEMQSIVTKTSKDVAGSSTKVMVLSIPLAGKRRQMAHGIQRVLADDDVFWPPMLLPYLLACFEVPEVGGVGTGQHAHVPPDAALSLWQYLAARRLEKRNISISASNYIDGGVTCLSRRTVAYRAEILTDEAFIFAFTHDYWRGRYLLDSGDDTFITRW